MMTLQLQKYNPKIPKTLAQILDCLYFLILAGPKTALSKNIFLTWQLLMPL